MKPIAIYGAGGFGKEILCLINEINQIKPTWKPIGFLDDNLCTNQSIKSLPILGGLDYLNNLSIELSIVFAIANTNHIKFIIENLSNNLIDFPNLISPGVKFYEESSLSIGKGNVIINGSRLSCDVKIGNFNLLNGSVILGHDVKIGNYNMINSGSRISGNASLGNLNFLGLEVIILQGIEIGDSNRIGVRSVVTKNIETNWFCFGNPAKKIEKINGNS